MPIRSPMDTRPTVVAFAGRRIDAEGAKAARFPFANVGAVRAAIGASLERIAPYLLIASAACGADLMALQAAASGHIRMRIVLPFPPAALSQELGGRPAESRILGQALRRCYQPGGKAWRHHCTSLSRERWECLFGRKQGDYLYGKCGVRCTFDAACRPHRLGWRPARR
jgi:hypothetical protein